MDADVLKFENDALARNHLTHIGYSYSGLDTFGVDGNIYLFNGPKTGERAGLFYKQSEDRWTVAFWNKLRTNPIQ